MAALTATEKTKRLPLGDRAIKTFRVGPTNATPANATEWFVTGFRSVDAILGVAVVGIADAGVNVVPNAQGTGVAENTNPGDVGIESTLASTSVDITVLGVL